MKVAIIDDEINNIANLKSLIKDYCPELKIIGIATDFKKAKTLLTTLQIDLLFLDIKMPDKSGFDLLSELPAYSFQVIFVTAFDQFAIKAIKYSALDYLLKPINIEELISAVRRAENKISDNVNKQQINHLVHLLKEKENEHRIIALPSINEIRYVPIFEIVKCQSENNYTIFFLSDGTKIVVSKGIYEYDEILPKDFFLRCHQSFIVNKKMIKSLIKSDTIYHLRMKDDSMVPVSRSKKDLVKQSLQHYK